MFYKKEDLAAEKSELFGTENILYYFEISSKNNSAHEKITDTMGFFTFKIMNFVSAVRKAYVKEFNFFYF